MKIAQVCPSYYPSIGGVETHVKEISERLVQKGFKVDVLTTDPKGTLPREATINGVNVKRFKSWAPSDAFWFSRELKSYLKKNSNNYDIVHAHSYHALPSLYAAQSKGNNKLIYTPHYHGTGHTFFRCILHFPYKYVAKKTFIGSDLIIFVSKYEKNLALETFKVKDGKMVVIPNGLNLKEFKDFGKGKIINRSILYVGRLEKYKGIDFLIKVLPALDKDVCLEIVGKGPYLNALLKLTNGLGIKDRVRFFQNLPRNELLHKYASAGVFIMLSKHESFGIGVAEALAAGTPCIVANTSALSEWIDNDSCYGVKYPIDLNELSCLIPKIIGRQFVTKNLLDWDDVVSQLNKLYNELLK